MNLIEKDIRNLINDDPKTKDNILLLDFLDSLSKYVKSRSFKADRDFEDLILLLGVALVVDQDIFTKTLQRMVITQHLDASNLREEAMNALANGDSMVRLEIVIEKKSKLVH